MTGSRRPGATAVHSVDHFVFSVPDLEVAETFYRAFMSQEPSSEASRRALALAPIRLGPINPPREKSDEAPRE